MLDLNNRPGGPNLIVTAKTAHKVHFLDAATLATSVTLDMPGSTPEIALSVDGRTAYATIYGDGIFGKNVNPDRRIAVIDLPSRSLARTIDLGGVVAPHGIMIDADDTVWCTGELGRSVFALNPKTGALRNTRYSKASGGLTRRSSTRKECCSLPTSPVKSAESILPLPR